MTIRGDMPGGPTQPWVRHPEGLANATELVELVNGLGGFCIGVAAFPTCTPNSTTPTSTLGSWWPRSRPVPGSRSASCSSPPSATSTWSIASAALGSELPIVPGIMPVTRLSQIQRFAELSGPDLPGWVVARLEAAGRRSRAAV